MSDDLIRRSDAIDAIAGLHVSRDKEKIFKAYAENPHSITTDFEGTLIDAINAVEAIPSADRPQGEWIRTFDGNEWFWYCSNCKTQWYEDDLWMGGNEFPHFCPNCGARMKGADDETD